MSSSLPPWQLRGQTFAWGKRTYVMGIINATPDSFSDGGQNQNPKQAIRKAKEIAPYVDLIDIGGESTRPGATPVSAVEEINRVVPLIKALRRELPNMPISIDTMKSTVASAALDAGADIINDVTAGRFDPDMLPLAGRRRVPVILMHMQGKPQTMQQNPQYENVLAEVKDFLRQAIEVAVACGLPRHYVAIDPGIGFGKNLDHNLSLLRDLGELRSLNAPMLVGPSRKNFIGIICDQPEPETRKIGTLAACSAAIAGSADILRVHDPKILRDVRLVSDAIFRSQS